MVKSKPHIAYANIDASIILSMDGVLAQNEMEANHVCRQEAKAIIKIDGEEPREDDLKIYWKHKESCKEYPFCGDAVVVYIVNRSNRQPMTIPREEAPEVDSAGFFSKGVNKASGSRVRRLIQAGKEHDEQ